MIWANPWAWLGAAGIALPIFIHLLARGHARVHRFPTLRFLETSTLLPTRRTNVHDVLLLVVRCSVIVLAAAALAQPILMTSRRRAALDRGAARAIVLDTSASMHRQLAGGGTALDSARKIANTLAASATVSVIVPTAEPNRAVDLAERWLLAQGRRAELVVVSDFQVGALDSARAASVPRSIGISLRRVAAQPLDSVETIGVASDTRIVARARVPGNAVDAAWTSTGIRDSSSAPVLLIAARRDSAASAAARAAAATIATPLPFDTAQSIAIVFPDAPERDRLRASVRPVTQPWMARLVARAHMDSLIVDDFGVADVAGRPRLVLFASAPAGSIESARLIAAAVQATSIAAPARELDPIRMPDASLAALQRPAIDAPTQFQPTDSDAPSDGRWLWLAAVVMLMLELALRRAGPATAPAVSDRDEARAA